ncbi:MAG: hypothetical protein HY873_13125 [Chloroflexi bacterium]|nr:hypothetical protein [Chloroflexota bacterium]
MAIAWESTESGAAAYISNVTPTTLYTNAQGAGKIVRLEKLIITNVNVAARSLALYKVPSGGAISGDDWKIIYSRSIDASGEEDIREAAGLMLDNGDSIRALASAASSLRFDLGLAKES